MEFFTALNIDLGSAVLLRYRCFTEWSIYKQVLSSRSSMTIRFNLLMAKEYIRLEMERFLLKLLHFTTRNCISQADIIVIVVISDMVKHLDFDHDKDKIFFHAPKRPECLWGSPSFQFFPQ
jgi:hypothetical protein